MALTAAPVLHLSSAHWYPAWPRYTPSVSTSGFGGQSPGTPLQSDTIAGPKPAAAQQPQCEATVSPTGAAATPSHRRRTPHRPAARSPAHVRRSSKVPAWNGEAAVSSGYGHAGHATGSVSPRAVSRNRSVASNVHASSPYILSSETTHRALTGDALRTLHCFPRRLFTASQMQAAHSTALCSGLNCQMGARPVRRLHPPGTAAVLLVETSCPSVTLNSSRARSSHAVALRTVWYPRDTQVPEGTCTNRGRMKANDCATPPHAPHDEWHSSCTRWGCGYHGRTSLNQEAHCDSAAKLEQFAP
eukprot:gene16303-biopygen16421